MTNIQLTAIRLIANNYLFSQEKNKESHGYRFDSSFLTKRGITTVKDMEALQEELNKRGWCFNILSFNDYVIQEKSFLAEMTKLGFGRMEGKTDEELNKEVLAKVNEKISTYFYKFLTKENEKETDLRVKGCVFEKSTVVDIDACNASSSIQYRHSDKENIYIPLFLTNNGEEATIKIYSQPLITVKSYNLKSLDNKFKEAYELIKDAFILKTAASDIIKDTESIVDSYKTNSNGLTIQTQFSRTHRIMYSVYAVAYDRHNEMCPNLLFKLYQEKFEMWIEWGNERCPVVLGSYLNEQSIRNKFEEVLKDILSKIN